MQNPLFSNVYKSFTSRQLYFVLFWLFSGFNIYTGAFAQDYAVSAIPENLKASAKIVIRSKETKLELISDDRARLTEKIAITILNENGIEDSKLILPYYKFSKVKNISGSVFNADGQRIRKIDGDEILDFSSNNDNSGFEDSRVKFIDPKETRIPFTVVYAYEIVYTDILDYPDFYLVEDYNISVERATFNIISKLENGFRYQETNLPVCYKAATANNEFSWTFSNVKTIRDEILSPSFFEICPTILISPNEFKMEGRKGNSSTWKDFGQWIYELNDGLNILEEESMNEIKSLVKDETDTLNMVRKLYEYMQDNTRYVSIQIGIGGWQTFPAETVDRLGYGDCKALTNYMQSILDYIGISSWYTLVRAGRYAPPINITFPSNQFNHVFLCVPLSEDTLWLECTNQNIPCGSLNSFTDDRNVLMITKDGGKISHTPAFTSDGNKQHRNITVQLDADGYGQAKVSTFCNGAQYESMAHLLRLDKVDQRKQVIKSITIPNFDLLDYDLKENRSISPSIIESLNLNLNQYGKFVNDKLLIQLNIMSVLESMPYESHRRQYDIQIRRTSLESDSVFYQLPEGFQTNNLPPENEIITPFGEYHSSVEPTGNGFLYIRNFILFKGTYPSGAYDNFIDFTEKINQADNQKIALVKKDSDSN